jgi:hypothetical protein
VRKGYHVVLPICTQQKRKFDLVPSQASTSKHKQALEGGGARSASWKIHEEVALSTRFDGSKSRRQHTQHNKNIWI